METQVFAAGVLRTSEGKGLGLLPLALLQMEEEFLKGYGGDHRRRRRGLAIGAPRCWWKSRHRHGSSVFAAVCN